MPNYKYIMKSIEK